MRKAVTYGLFFLAGHAAVASADAAYVIKLKNGNEYITSRYWNEGGQVCFDTYDGIFGVEKSFVLKIEKTEKVVRLARVLEQEPVASPQTLSSKKEGDETQRQEKGEGAIKRERDPNDPIVGEFNRLKEKTAEVDGMLTSEIRELLNQITAFKNKLAKDSKAFVQYGREFNDLQELGNLVENALRSRTQ
jgi:hypothetical protein